MPEDRGNGKLRALALSDGLAQAGRVPVDDDRAQQVERGHAEMLAFRGPIADFTLSADPQSVLQRVVRLALVEADLRRLSQTIEGLQGKTDDMDLNEDRIDDAVLALRRLTLHDGRRAWQGFDWDSMDRLHQKRWITNPVGKARSVAFTDDGLQRSERLLHRLFGKGSAQAL